MSKLDDILRQLHQSRRDIDEQIAQLSNSEGTTEEIVQKLRELRRRQESTEPGRQAN